MPSEPDPIVIVHATGDIYLLGESTTEVLVRRKWWQFWRPRYYHKVTHSQPGKVPPAADFPLSKAD